MDRIAEVQQKQGIVGRADELRLLLACAAARRHVLLEGPVGVGKTVLARAVAAALGRPIIRVDGDGRYTEQKLTGWFDPPVVMKSGYVPEAFLAGPLVEAMREGGVLFLNELNRMPEGVQNVLLPALDEGTLVVPKLGAVTAAPGFWVVATQNPREFVATSHLSEALLDRFELVRLEHPPEEEELAIVQREVRAALATGEKGASKPPIAAATIESIEERALALVRATREDPRLRRGASVRAAISISLLAIRLAADGLKADEAFDRAVAIALPTRVELADDAAASVGDVLAELADEAGKKKILTDARRSRA